MGWDEKQFQTTNAKETGRTLVSPAALMLELSAGWHPLVKRGQRLPCTSTCDIKTSGSQSTVPLRLFMGNTPDERKYLSNVDFLGITGFNPREVCTLTLTLSIDENGVMTMYAKDSLGGLLSIGPHHQKTEPGVWRDFPNQQQSPRLRWYYFTQCGSFLAAFAYHFIEDKKKDFWMMLFHHVCSVVLISGSWTWGAARIGCVVLFSRELSDVCIHAAKAYSLMGPQYSTLATSWFVVLLTTWVPLRLILYPILIRSAMLDSLPAVAQYPHLNVPWWVCCVGLSTLAPMDWIWFSFGVSIGLRKLKTGKLEDSRDIRKKAA